jgi:MFS family permease
VALTAFTLAVATAMVVIRPLHGTSVEFDSAASVLYFDRIIAGHHLEAPVGATPKPFLTVVFGLLYGLSHDWRVLVWATVAAYGGGISLAAVLARRVAGIGGAAFVTVALIASAPLLVDVSRAYAVAWALLGWAIAGLAVTAKHPRYDIAALALFLASLARIETFVVLVTAAFALFAASVLARRREDLAPPRAALILLTAFLALPVMLLHDWLLTGDPFWFVNVSARYSAAVPDVVAIQTPTYMVFWVTRYILGFGMLTILAFLGFLLVVRRRQISLALGLLALGLGVGAFLVLLSVRGTFVSTRYATPMGLAIMFLAGVGFGSVRVPWLVSWARVLVRHPPWRRSGIRTAIAVVTIVVATVSAAALVRPFGPRDAATNSAIANSLDQAVDVDRLLPLIRNALGSVPGAFDPETDSSLAQDHGTASVLLYVPALDRPRFAVDLGLPLFRIEGNPTAGIDPDALVSVPGRIVYHDRRRDVGSGFAALESSSPTIEVGDGTLVLLASDATRGYWLWQVAARKTPVGPSESGRARAETTVGGPERAARPGHRLSWPETRCAPRSRRSSGGSR